MMEQYQAIPPKDEEISHTEMITTKTIGMGSVAIVLGILGAIGSIALFAVSDAAAHTLVLASAIVFGSGTIALAVDTRSASGAS